MNKGQKKAAIKTAEMQFEAMGKRKIGHLTDAEKEESQKNYRKALKNLQTLKSR